MNQTSKWSKMLTSVVAEGGSCSLSREMNFKMGECLLPHTWWSSINYENDNKRQEKSNGRQQGGREKQVTGPENLPSPFPYYSFQGVLVLAALKDLAIKGKVVLLRKHFHSTDPEKLQWNILRTRREKALSGPCSLSLHSNAKLSRHPSFPQFFQMSFNVIRS